MHRLNQYHADINRSIITTRRVAALDHSDAANVVLQYNDDCDTKNSMKSSTLTATQSTPTNSDKRSQKKARRNKNTHQHITKKAIAIERLTVDDLSNKNRLLADIWAMSPPCQPYTRNNEVPTDASDPRAKSFLHLCRLIASDDADADDGGCIATSKLPRLILMENVVGFEKSECCQIFRKNLLGRGYRLAHFHLNPTQFGISNDRPRYYCVAILDVNVGGSPRWNDDNDDFVPLDGVGKLKIFETVAELQSSPIIHDRVPAIVSTIISPLLALNNDMDTDDMDHNEDGASIKATCTPEISTYLDADLIPNEKGFNENKFQTLLIPSTLLQKSAAWCFDIVTPLDRRSACFTHGYGQFVRGTGSVLFTGHLTEDVQQQLALVDPERRRFDPEWWSNVGYLEGNLRYLAGSEIARLMGFPMICAGNTDVTTERRFRFPPSTSTKKQYQLLGNSLNVCVASRIGVLGIFFVLGLLDD